MRMTGLAGKTLGRYHIVEQLGEGGMATVYQAFDTRLQRNVAVKVIRPDQAQAPGFIARFEREARALARLDHSSIVKVFDYGEQDGVPYLVMGYLPGGTLKQRMGQLMPFREAAHLLVPMARALEYAHNSSIIHRDVKPANILFNEAGEPMLSDFGIAKMLEKEQTVGLTGTGVGIGTPEYMAPEQWMGDVLPQTDIYALGVVFFELVTGRKPYTADTPAAVLLKQANDPLPRPRDFVSGLPDEVERTIFKALAKRPEDRFETMGAFAMALDELQRLSDEQTERLIETQPYYEGPRESVEKGAEFLQPPQSGTVQAPPTGTGVGASGPAARQAAPLESRASARSYLWVGGGILALGVIGVIIVGALFFLLRPKLPGAAPATEAAAVSAVTQTGEPTAASTEAPTATALPTQPPTETPLPTDTPLPEWTIGSLLVSDVDGMEMVYVPEGDFLMGSTDDQVELALQQCNRDQGYCKFEWFEDEYPQLSVFLDAYFIDKYEVTNDQYAQCVAAGACQPPVQSNSNTRDSYYGNPAFEDFPVLYVRWQQAVDYCEWAGRRLPTEAEWEKAARGTDGRTYPWGEEIDCSYANYGLMGGKLCNGDTVAIASYADRPSPYGALDMAGNVWEWVADWYDAGYYLTDPQDKPQGPESGEDRVRRGGGWNYASPVYSRAASREGMTPTYLYDTGIRCAWTP